MKKLWVLILVVLVIVSVSLFAYQVLNQEQIIYYEGTLI